MVSVADSLPHDLLCPRTLSVLMGVYERNYERLVRLLGDPLRIPMRRRVCLPGRPQLYVEVTRRSRYTVELVLTHRFGQERLPELAVRMYRDARLAEALPLAPGTHPGRPLARLPERWRANLLLYKWLEYCADALHAPGTPQPA